APFAQREALETAEKRRIARRAAEMIAPGQVAIVDGGTTSALLVSQLPADLRATIVTHSPSVAVALAAHPSIDVILIGGRLYKHSIVAVGAAAMEGIARIHADLYFMGVTGVHPVAGLSTGDFEEAAIKRALAERAAETVVLASQSKLRAASQFVIGELTLAHTVVVEKETDAALTKPIEAAGVTVVRA
ncbi:DeoR/GlpR family DNA-binding transcription regulator, partial [Burkholderia sp. Ac-20392]